jgi:hypothetical protein
MGEFCTSAARPTPPSGLDGHLRSGVRTSQSQNDKRHKFMGRVRFLRLPVAFALQHARRNTATVDTETKDLTLGADMRVLLAFAIIISAAIGMGGCFWHHQQAVQTQPLK